ncbi:MAG TPA: hypothetical protein IAD33_00780 [Candidatus Scatomorpha gallistercoris]|nr:hypothetical protein [Candidatus Scatomorpha gallistercoris]
MATYDPNVDYSDLIAQEAAKGVNANRQLLAQYEAQRNAKITAERLPYAQTSVYTNELGRPLGYYQAEDRSDYINELYDTAREQALSALESAYDREVTSYDYAAARIPAQYYDARNAASAEAALARQSVNEQFAASGLNTGAAGQARLSLAVAEQGALGALGREQAAALAELEMRRAEAESEYKAAVAEAIASSELERAQALYDEAVRVESSYRTYSEDLLAAWGLTLAGTPAAAETAAAGTSGGGGRTAARKTDDEPAPPSAQELADNAAALRSQLSRIPGLTRENKAGMVRDYFANGRISYDDMQSLLAGI